MPTSAIYFETFGISWRFVTEKSIISKTLFASVRKYAECGSEICRMTNLLGTEESPKLCFDALQVLADHLVGSED